MKRLGSPCTANEAAENFRSLTTKLNDQPNTSHQDATVGNKGLGGLPPVAPDKGQARMAGCHHPNAQGGNVNMCDDASNASGDSRSSIEQQIMQKLADSQIELAKSSQENFKLQQKMQEELARSNQELAKSNQENFKLQQKTLEAIAVGQDLPLVTLKKFNGDPSKFPAFMNGFESLVKQKVKDPARLFHTLLEYCEGEALRVIQDFSVLPPDTAYKEALEVLRLHFGQSHLVARALIDSLLNYEHLEKNRNVPLGKKLLAFSTKMTSVRFTLQTYKREADVNSSETLKVLVAKLPNYGINEWKKDAARIYENGHEPNLEDFINLVKRLASRENHTYSEVQSAKERREYIPKDN